MSSQESDILLVEEPARALGEYAAVPITFEVRARFRVEPVDRGLGGLRLVREAVEPSYTRDYDDDGGPERWLNHWDLRNWGIISAYAGSRRAGGLVLAWRTAGVNMLEGRDDLAVVWDLRVHPDYRRRGIGGRLFEEAVNWARVRGCTAVKVETQNINVPACEFYARQGCRLSAVNLFAYKDEPEEVQLIWRLNI